VDRKSIFTTEARSPKKTQLIHQRRKGASARTEVPGEGGIGRKAP